MSGYRRGFLTAFLFYRFPFYRFPGDSVAAARMALSRPERYILWRTG